MVNIKKKQAVEELAKLLEETNHFILVSFGAASNKQLETLRKRLKQIEARLKVVKNSLFQKTVNKLSSKNKLLLRLRNEEFPLKNNTAFVKINKDWLSCLKLLNRFKTEQQSFNFKSAILEGELYQDNDLVKLANLPNQNQLIANLTELMKSPSVRLITASKFNTNRLIFILKHKQNKNQNS